MNFDEVKRSLFCSRFFLEKDSDNFAKFKLTVSTQPTEVRSFTRFTEENITALYYHGNNCF